MFGFTNWQRRYCITQHYDVMMQCSLQTCVLSLNAKSSSSQGSLTTRRHPNTITEATEGRLPFYLMVWFGPILQILQSIGLGTWSPFPSTFHCTVSYRLCGMLLYHDLSPTHRMQQSGGGGLGGGALTFSGFQVKVQFPPSSNWH